MVDRKKGKLFIAEGRMEIVSREGMQDIRLNKLPLGSLIVQQLGLLEKAKNGRDWEMSLGRTRIWVERLDG
ncbi:MAG: hypothetical protein GTO63_29815 [Anaerolineae bacterium]|nr:hypothetical protein [Anaerolineae bacterium]NIN98914.1 hypothetical protein [Anaerolineae bacterium]NIQ81821.1 hypothetical protein [Anaerolineae bacterium]